MPSAQEPRSEDSAPATDGERRESAGGEQGTGAQLADEARATGRELDSGSRIRLLGGEVSRRTLLALAAFVVVFLLVWLVLWGMFGGAGLVLGWIAATVAGGAAVWLLARRSAAR